MEQIDRSLRPTIVIPFRRAIRYLSLLALILVVLCSGAPAFSQSAPNDPRLMGLVRDRRQAEAMNAIRRLETAGNPVDFCTAVQWLLDQPRDAFLVTREGEVRSIRGMVEQTIQSVGRERQDDYRRIIGPTALAEWQRAKLTPEDQDDCSVVRRFFYTEVGGQAAVSLVFRWLDQGTHDLAASLGLRVLQEPMHRELQTSDLIYRVATALSRANRWEELRGLQTAYPEQKLSATVVFAPPAFESSTVMQQPSWTAPLGPLQESRNASGLLRQWLGQQRELESPAALAARPVVAGRELLYRDLDTLRAIDVQTGQVAWEYAATPGYEAALPDVSQDEATVRARRFQFSELIAANSAFNNLATDGRRAYLLDDIAGALDALSRPAEFRDQTPAERRAATRNRLIAVRLGAELAGQPRVIWSTADGAGAPGGPLDGHVFLGPPLLTAGWLYVMTEADRELSLVALNPQTGAVRWVQPIAEADRAFFEDRARGLRDCVPTLAGGLVLCPTHLGMLVAVDAVTGRLAWVHTQQDPVPEGKPNVFRPGPTASAQLRPAAFSPQAFVAEGRLFFLAGQAAGFYRIDLITGATVWRIDAPTADAVVHATREAAYLVYRDAVRAHAAEDGHLLWQARLPAAVSGRPIAFSDQLYIPLVHGGLMRIQLRDGRVEPGTFTGAPVVTGHLVATADGLAALGSEGLAGYRFTRRVRADMERQRLTSGGETAAEQLQWAELLLAEGAWESAAARLETLRRELRTTDRARCEALLRTTYRQLLRQSPEQAERWLTQWEPLCTSPQDRTQWLVERGERSVADRDQNGLRRVLLELLRQPTLDELTPVVGEDGLAVSSLGWMRRALRDGRLAEDRRFLTEVAAVTDSDPTGGAARRAEACLPETPLAEELRMTLVEQAIARGQWHAAESWLLRNIESDVPLVAGSATRRLAELYEQGERYAAAAELRFELQGRFAETEVASGVTGRAYVADRPEAGWTAEAVRRRRHWTSGLGPVAVREVRQPPAEGLRIDAALPDDEPDFTTDRLNRWRQSPREDSDFEWSMRVGGGDAWLIATDRAVQQPLLKLRFPGTSFTLPQVGTGAWPHALPIGTAASMQMASLLQGTNDGRAWQTSLPEWAGRSGMPLCGPVTPRMALFQLRSTLVALDPAEGRVLWRRNDLEPNSGLMVNDRAGGLLLSNEVVGVVTPDRMGFRLFDAATGSSLKTVRPGVNPKNQKRVVVGARVAFWVEGSDGGRIAIWDAATDRRILEDSLIATQFFDLVQDRQSLFWVNEARELCIYDMVSGRFVARCQLEQADLDSVASMRVMKQAGRYLVNFGRPLQLVRTEHYHQHPNGHTLPVQMVRDGFLGLNEAGTQVAWRTVIPQSALLLWGKLPVPVLVLLGQIRDKHDANRLWNRIEVRDLATGERLGGRDQILRDEWRTADYDGTRGVLTIRGPRNTIEIDLSTPRPLQLDDGQPL